MDCCVGGMHFGSLDFYFLLCSGHDTTSTKNHSQNHHIQTVHSWIDQMTDNILLFTPPNLPPIICRMLQVCCFLDYYIKSPSGPQLHIPGEFPKNSLGTGRFSRFRQEPLPQTVLGNLLEDPVPQTVPREFPTQFNSQI